MARRLFLFIILSALGIGCLPGVAPIGDHTVRVQGDKEADILWVVRGKELYRCTGESGKPVCQKASGLEDDDHRGLGQHTIEVSEQKDADVIWVLSSKLLHRCTGESGEPVCEKVTGIAAD